MIVNPDQDTRIKGGGSTFNSILLSDFDVSDYGLEIFIDLFETQLDMDFLRLDDLEQFIDTFVCEGSVLLVNNSIGVVTGINESRGVLIIDWMASIKIFDGYSLSNASADEGSVVKWDDEDLREGYIRLDDGSRYAGRYKMPSVKFENKEYREGYVKSEHVCIVNDKCLAEVFDLKNYYVVSII